MRILELTDMAYEEYLRPYYENLTREKAVIGSLFSVDTSVLSDDELAVCNKLNFQELSFGIPRIIK